MRLSTFELDWRLRKGGRHTTERRYLDFVVDGHSLVDSVQPGDIIGCLGWGAKESERQSIEQLMLKAKSRLGDGRVPIYVCPECGDLGCGAVIARIERTPMGFRWADFGFEDGLEGGVHRQYQNVGPFEFGEEEYVGVLMKRLVTLAA